MANLFDRDSFFFTASTYCPLNSQTSIPASYNVNMNPAFIQAGTNYQLSITKSRIPLTEVPLTNNNIPINTYACILKQTLPGPPIKVIETPPTFVRQINSSNSNFVYNMTAEGVFTKSLYSSTGVLTTVSSFSLTGVWNVFQILVDEFENVYIVANNIPGGSGFSNMYIYSIDGTFIRTYTFTSIQSVYIANNQNVFVADIDLSNTSSVKCLSNVNSAGAVELSSFGTITTNFNNNPITSVATVNVNDVIIVGYGGNKITIYTTDLVPISDSTLLGITQIGPSSAQISEIDRFAMIDNGIIYDIYYGLTTDANPTSNNMTTNTPFLPALQTPDTWGLDGGPIILSIMGGQSGKYVGYSETSNYLYSGDYNNGVNPGQATLLDNTMPIYGVFAYGEANFIAMGLVNQLYAWDYYGTGSGWYTLSNTFIIPDTMLASNFLRRKEGVGRQPFLCCCSQNNNTYQTNLPFYEKNFMTSYNGTQCKIMGQEKNNNFMDVAGYQFSSSVGITAIIGSFYYSQNIYTFGNTSSGVMWMGQFNLSTLAYTQTQLGGGLNMICLTLIPSGYVAIVSGGGLSDYVLLVYPLSGASPLPFTASFTLANPAVSITSAVSSSQGAPVIVIANSQSYHIFKYDGPTSTLTELLISTLFIPPAYPSTFIGGVVMGPDDIVYFEVSTSFLTPTTYTTIYECLFANGLTFAITDYNAIIQSTRTSGWSYNNSLCLLGDEIFVGTLGQVNSEVDTFNIGGTSAIFKGTTSFPSSNYGGMYPYLYVLPNVDFCLVRWNTIFTGIPGGALQISESAHSPGIMYAITPAGVPYRGTDPGSFSWQMVPYTGFSGTAWKSINLTFPTQALFNSTVYNYKISDQSAEGVYPATGLAVSSIARNTVTNQFIIGTSGGQLVCLDPTTATTLETPVWTSAYTGVNALSVKSGSDIYVPGVPIWTYSQLIDQINAMFATAWQTLTDLGGTLAEAPSISVNYSTGLVTMTYSKDYAQLGNGIIFNNALLNLLYFDSFPDKTLKGYNDIILSPTGTLTQTASSIWIFNQLDKIIFKSSNLQTKGGNLFGSNSSSNVIGDFDVPTSELAYQLNNIGNVVYYQPSIYNPLVLNIDTSLNVIDITAYYQMLDGTQYPILLIPGQNFTAKLIFARKY